MGTDDNRRDAIARIEAIGAQLERERERHPNPGTYTPASAAERYNEALFLLHDELGLDWVRSHNFGMRAVIPKARQGSPTTDVVPRDSLLTKVQRALEDLQSRE